ncbi:MAG TPA: PH domain-containing protein [Candidatus Avimonas sp.]|nr:PH domain-containing protein [Candidatus Avimonas sp.]
MQLSADKGAEKVITLWITLAGVAASSIISALAGLITPWLLILTIIAGVITVVAAIWYPPEYARHFKGSFDGYAIRATTGVFIKKELFVPVKALRTFDLCSTPVQRLFGCRTVILRFAGGAALLPLLPAGQAEKLVSELERIEDCDC